jgi:hypothetical protein
MKNCPICQAELQTNGCPYHMDAEIRDHMEAELARARGEVAYWRGEATKADHDRATARLQLAQLVQAAGVVIEAFKFTERAGELGTTHYTLPADAVVPFKTLYKRCNEARRGL